MTPRPNTGGKTPKNHSRGKGSKYQIISRVGVPITVTPSDLSRRSDFRVNTHVDDHYIPEYDALRDRNLRDHLNSPAVRGHFKRVPVPQLRLAYMSRGGDGEQPAPPPASQRRSDPSPRAAANTNNNNTSSTNPNPLISPARAAMQTLQNHTNSGWVQERTGFLPPERPKRRFPSSHRAWDEAAKRVPQMISTKKVRQELDKLPYLPTEQQFFPEKYLRRAALVLGIFATAYRRFGNSADPMEDPEKVRLPANIEQPWRKVCERLGRPGPELTFDDMVLYNWRLRSSPEEKSVWGIDGRPIKRVDPEDMRLETMELLVPVFGTDEERIYYLVQVEIMAQCAPVVGRVLEAQECNLRGDVAGLKEHLLAIRACIAHATRYTLPKLSTNPLSRTYIDPGVWSSTVAVFGAPMGGGRGVNCAANPVLRILDIFLGRTFPVAARRETDYYLKFFDAVQRVSVKEFVESCKDPELRGMFQSIVEEFAGDSGFLGVHRQIVYSFLDVAFRPGRDDSGYGLRGDNGVRSWESITGRLEKMADKRRALTQQQPTYIDVVHRHPGGQQQGRWVLDVTSSGMEFLPGDSFEAVVSNSHALVDIVMGLLRAKAKDCIGLSDEWASYLGDAGEKVEEDVGRQPWCPLRSVLAHAQLSPAPRALVRAVAQITPCARVSEMLLPKNEGKYDAVDVLEVMVAQGGDPSSLLVSGPACDLFSPADPRAFKVLYVVELKGRRELHAVSPRLRIERRAKPAGQFVNPNKPSRARITGIVRAAHFRLPPPHRAASPVVMIACGSDISIFFGFLKEREKQAAAAAAAAAAPAAAKDWLLFGTRGPSKFYYRAELEEYVRRGRVGLSVAFSDEELAPAWSPDKGRFVFERGPAMDVTGLMLTDDKAEDVWEYMRADATFYVCGTSAMVKGVRAALAVAIQRATGKDEAQAGQVLDRMSSNGRLFVDIRDDKDEGAEPSSPAAPAAPGADADPAPSENPPADPPARGPPPIRLSELASHNKGEGGLWVAVGDRVYDVAPNLQRHMSARAIVENAGLVATTTIERLGGRELIHPHHLVGVLERPDIADPLTRDCFEAWTSYMFLLTEMENSLMCDLGADAVSGDRLRAQAVRRSVHAHSLFVNNFLPVVTGEMLDNLWALNIGIMESGRPVYQLQNEVLRLYRSVDGQFVTKTVRYIEEMLIYFQERPRVSYGEWAEMREVAAILREHDTRTIAGLKEIARSAVSLFEDFPARVVVEYRGEDVLDLIDHGIVSALQTYFAELASELRSLASTRLEEQYREEEAEKARLAGEDALALQQATPEPRLWRPLPVTSARLANQPVDTASGPSFHNFVHQIKGRRREIELLPFNILYRAPQKDVGDSLVYFVRSGRDRKVLRRWNNEAHSLLHLMLPVSGPRPKFWNDPAHSVTSVRRKYADIINNDVVLSRLTRVMLNYIDRYPFMSPRVVVLGGPKSGKRPICEAVSRQLALTHVSAPRLCDERVGVTWEDQNIAGVMRGPRGEYPDDVVVELVRRELDTPEMATRGWVVDGFPASAAQADALLALVGGQPVHFVLLEIPAADSVARFAEDRRAGSEARGWDDERVAEAHGAFYSGEGSIAALVRGLGDAPGVLVRSFDATADRDELLSSIMAYIKGEEAGQGAGGGGGGAAAGGGPDPRRARMLAASHHDDELCSKVGTFTRRAEQVRASIADCEREMSSIRERKDDAIAQMEAKQAKAAAKLAQMKAEGLVPPAGMGSPSVRRGPIKTREEIEAEFSTEAIEKGVADMRAELAYVTGELAMLQHASLIKAAGWARRVVEGTVQTLFDCFYDEFVRYVPSAADRGRDEWTRWALEEGPFVYGEDIRDVEIGPPGPAAPAEDAGQDPPAAPEEAPPPSADERAEAGLGISNDDEGQTVTATFSVAFGDSDNVIRGTATLRRDLGSPTVRVVDYEIPTNADELTKVKTLETSSRKHALEVMLGTKVEVMPPPPAEDDPAAAAPQLPGEGASSEAPAPAQDTAPAADPAPARASVRLAEPPKAGLHRHQSEQYNEGGGRGAPRGLERHESMPPLSAAQRAAALKDIDAASVATGDSGQ